MSEKFTQKSESISTLATNLAAFQGEMPEIKLESDVTFKTTSGATFSFKYAALPHILKQILPVLSKNGLSITQLTESTEDGNQLRTILLDKSGEYISSCIPINLSGDMKDVGGRITYLKRYSLTALLGIAGEEDTDAGDKKNDLPTRKKTQSQKAPTVTFESILPKEINKDSLTLYLKKMAQEYDCSVEDVKANATKQPKEFLKAFDTWQKKAPAKSEPKTTDTIPEDATKARKRLEILLKENLIDREKFKQFLEAKNKLTPVDGKLSMTNITDSDINNLIAQWESAILPLYDAWAKENDPRESDDTPETYDLETAKREVLALGYRKTFTPSMVKKFAFWTHNIEWDGMSIEDIEGVRKNLENEKTIEEWRQS